MKTYEEMINEIENGGIYFTTLTKKCETYEEASRFMGNEVGALSKKGGLLTGYYHRFNENGYMYSYVYNEKTKQQEKVNIYNIKGE